MSSLLLLDCYLWESSRALVDDITAMAAAAFSDWTRCVNFFAQHQCLWWLMRTVKNRLKRLASNGKKTRARFILIRTHTRSPFSFSLFFFPRIKQKPEDPHLPDRTFKYNTIAGFMRFPPLGFLWFLTSLFVTCGKKLAKSLFALKFEV